MQASRFDMNEMIRTIANFAGVIFARPTLFSIIDIAPWMLSARALPLPFVRV